MNTQLHNEYTTLPVSLSNSLQQSCYNRSLINNTCGPRVLRIQLMSIVRHWSSHRSVRVSHHRDSTVEDRPHNYEVLHEIRHNKQTFTWSMRICFFGGLVARFDFITPNRSAQSRSRIISSIHLNGVLFNLIFKLPSRDQPDVMSTVRTSSWGSLGLHE